MTREEAFLETYDCNHQVSLTFSICMSNDEPTGLDQTERQSLFLATHWSVVLKAGCGVTAPDQAALEKLCRAVPCDSNAFLTSGPITGSMIFALPPPWSRYPTDAPKGYRPCFKRP